MGKESTPEPMTNADKGEGVEKKIGEEEEELLNLIAEIIVEIIIKDSQNERDRICEDQ